MDESDDAQPELKKFDGGLPYTFVGPRVTPRRQRVTPGSPSSLLRSSFSCSSSG